MTDFGSDLSCVSDFTPDFAVATGKRCVAESVARRYITPRGRLIGDPNYGYDLTQFVNDDVGPADLARIEANAAAEAKKDERVQDAEVSISVTSAGVMIAKVTLETGNGPFVLVLSVTDVNVEILKL
jgi:phage baseplate assembly protein W